MLRSFECRSILAGESWCNPGLSPRETICDIFSISLVASTMDMCGRGQHKSGLDLSELVEAWDSSGTTAGACQRGIYLAKPCECSDRRQKDEDSWRMTRILHKNLSRFIQILDMLWHASCSATWASRNAESNSRLSLSRTWINAGRCASARPVAMKWNAILDFAEPMTCNVARSRHRCQWHRIGLCAAFWNFFWLEPRR